MDSDRPGKAETVDAGLLRRKIHRMIARQEADRIVLEWDKGYVFALRRVERLIDKMKTEKEAQA